MHDIKGNKLQINSVESREQVVIAIENLLRYAVELIPDSNYDLVPKWYVDNLISGAINETTTELTEAELEAEYPDSPPGFKVMADGIIDNPLIYIKGFAPGVWKILSLGSFA